MSTEKLSAFFKNAKKKYGDDIIADNSVKVHDIISTGSLSLDSATGIGGYARGKFYEIFAWEGVGKSTLGLHAIANAQKNGIRCALVDSEHSFDAKYAKAIGIDTSPEMLIQIRPSIVEEALNLIIELIRTGEVGLVVLDSLSALLPLKEFEGEIGDASMGVKARLSGQFCRKIKGELAKFNVCFISIGQVRDKITTYGDPTTTDYGNAVRFFADLRLQLFKSHEKDGDQIIGNRVRAKILKNKMGEPFQEAEFSIIFGQGINQYAELVEYAIKLDLIQKSGSWYSCGDMKIGQGIEKVYDFLDSNPELFEEMKQRIYESFKA